MVNGKKTHHPDALLAKKATLIPVIPVMIHVESVPCIAFPPWKAGVLPAAWYQSLTLSSNIDTNHHKPTKTACREVHHHLFEQHFACHSFCTLATQIFTPWCSNWRVALSIFERWWNLWTWWNDDFSSPLCWAPKCRLCYPVLQNWHYKHAKLVA